MGIAPYHHSYRRARPRGQAPHLCNPACPLTDQGADPDPADLAWRIRREWRVIYYSARQAAGLPLWPGVDDFEGVMTDVLVRLTSGFKPIAPMKTRAVIVPKGPALDRREDRIYQPSCRVFRTPGFDRRERAD
jgi:hypothetical protein